MHAYLWSYAEDATLLAFSATVNLLIWKRMKVTRRARRRHCPYLMLGLLPEEDGWVPARMSEQPDRSHRRYCLSCRSLTR